MEFSLLYIVCLMAALTPFVATYNHFKMLQQSSYYPSRYLKWLYDVYFTKLLLLTFIFCALSVVFRYSMVLELVIISLFAIAQLFITLSNRKKSIKRLVFTSRVYRLYTAAIVVQFALFSAVLFTKGALQGILFSLLMLLAVFAPLLVLLAWCITKPIENALAKAYTKSAKKILADSPELKVVGITGSYGKTSTKFILARILSEKYNVLATPQSFNTPMGVVRTIREKLRPQHEIFICEMGAKQKGDIKEICDIVHPDYALITSVGPQHLETFKSIDNVFATKFELYDATKAKGGTVYANLESGPIAEKGAGLDIAFYGGENSSCVAKDIKYSKEGSSFTIVIGDTKIPVTTKLLGRHNVLNILGAAYIAFNTFGLSDEEIRFAVSRLEPTEHRLELKTYIGGSLMIDDAYNANPEGCIEAVNVLSQFGDMKKVIITPGLVELGEQEYDFNYKLGLAAATVADEIILVGRNRAVPMREAIRTTDFNSDKVHIVSSFLDAVKLYKDIADKNTVVLVENDLPDNYLS